MKGLMIEQRIKIPSEAECRQLIAGMGMLENIVAHSRQVCRVSLLIVDHLKPDHLKPDGLNRDLIRATALLHDITKTRSFQTQEDHAETGAQLLNNSRHNRTFVLSRWSIAYHISPVNKTTKAVA